MIPTNNIKNEPTSPHFTPVQMQPRIPNEDTLVSLIGSSMFASPLNLSPRMSSTGNRKFSRMSGEDIIDILDQALDIIHDLSPSVVDATDLDSSISGGVFNPNGGGPRQ